MNRDARARIERFVEVALFAPVGVALTLRDMAPTFVNMFVSRGRAEIDRRQEGIERRVKTVKSTGEVALAFGVPMVRDKLVAGLARVRTDDARQGTGPTAPAAAAPTTELRLVVDTSGGGISNGSDHRVDGSAGVAPNVGANGDAGMRAEELAIPGYDTLAASQVVERLVGLNRPELEAVRDYEAANRNRRTILGKIEQLSGI